jgi:hypothetical protein
MSTWPATPTDVVDWFRNVFRAANWRLTETLLNVPSIRETTLDDTLIQALLPHSAPTRFKSGAAVRMDVHNVGGLRRVMSWEIGDIAILVFLVRRSAIVRRKVAVLQAKRLYPSSGQVDNDDPVGFRYGMSALLRPEESPTSMLLRRAFAFDNESAYVALRAASKQQRAIEDFESNFGKSIYYLMYNPPRLPLTVHYPIQQYATVSEEPELGTRVLPRATVHEILATLAEGKAPTFQQIKAAASSAGGWRLEEWAADLLLTCREGRPYDSPDETIVRRMLERRSGPIGAVIAVHIELPDDGSS